MYELLHELPKDFPEKLRIHGKSSAGNPKAKFQQF